MLPLKSPVRPTQSGHLLFGGGQTMLGLFVVFGLAHRALRRLLGDPEVGGDFRYGQIALTSTSHDVTLELLGVFAGHGFISGGKGYLAPFDIDLKNIAGTAFAMDRFGKDIGSNIHGKWKVLLTDACHSGAITPETDPQQLNQLLLDMHQSIFSLTASRDREQSFESADWGGGHGIFTYYVVQGLQGAADANGDGVVTADELAEYVHTNVRQATNSRQNPTSERGSFDPNMLLAFNPDRVKSAPQAALDYGTLIVQSNMDDTEFWLDGKKAGVVSKSAALRLPGLAPGSHTIKAVHLGYEPDGPRDEIVYPGRDSTVSLKILIARRRPKAALDEEFKGSTACGLVLSLHVVNVKKKWVAVWPVNLPRIAGRPTKRRKEHD